MRVLDEPDTDVILVDASPEVRIVETVEKAKINNGQAHVAADRTWERSSNAVALRQQEASAECEKKCEQNENKLAKSADELLSKTPKRKVVCRDTDANQVRAKPCATKCASAKTSEPEHKAKTFESKKNTRNQDRLSVFARLGKQQNLFAPNTNARRESEGRECIADTVYTDDTFGDINTNLSYLEKF